MRCGIALRRGSGARSKRRACPTPSTRATAHSMVPRSISTSRTRSAAPGSWEQSAGLRGAEAFSLNYVGEDNAVHRPVVIHRAVCGSLERFIAILIEHYAGAFPALARAITGHRSADCRSSCRIRPRGRSDPGRPGYPRAEVDERQEKVNYKIREAQLQKIPYMLVVGDKKWPIAPWPSQPEKGIGPPAAQSVRDRRACRGPEN